MCGFRGGVHRTGIFWGVITTEGTDVHGWGSDGLDRLPGGILLVGRYLDRVDGSVVVVIPRDRAGSSGSGPRISSAVCAEAGQ